MKPWKSWLACLGVAGACMAWAGCGKSDTPDPDNDPNAAQEAAPADAGAGQNVAQGAGAAQKGDAAAKEEEAPAAEEKTEAAAAETKGGSPTSEMLALSGNNAADDPQAASGAAAPAAGAAPGPGGAQPGASGPPGGGGQQIGMAPPRSGAPAGYPGAPGGANPQAQMRPPSMAGGPAGGQGMRPPGAPGGQGAVGFPGGQGGGGAAAADEPADFHTQTGAVTAFLNAIKAKDAVRLREATALRAEQENQGKRTEKLFKSILDESISQDELDDLAKKLDGYQIAGQNIPKSTSRLGIILQKADARGDMYQRTITVRREKDGWKVCEIGNEGRINQSMGTPTRRPTKR